MAFKITRTILASCITSTLLLTSPNILAESAHTANEHQQTYIQPKLYKFEKKSVTDSYLVHFKGDIEFSQDYQEIVSLSEHAYLHLETRSGFNDKSLEVLRNKDGSPNYSFKIDGKRQDFDEKAQAWLAEQVETLNPLTGIKTYTRTQQLMTSAGFDAVLSELERLGQFELSLNFGYINNDGSAEEAYLEALMNHYPLTAEQLAKLADIILENLGSQAAAKIILQLASQYPDNKKLTASLLQQAGDISSSSVSAETLLALAKTRSMSEPEKSIYLQSLSDISSGGVIAETLIASEDYCQQNQHLLKQCLDIVEDLSSSNALEVLKALALSSKLDKENLNHLLQAATGISSSSGQSDYLQSILAQQSLNESNIGALLSATGEISSSSEKANVLSALVKSQQISMSSWQALMRATENISSSSEAQRVMESIAGKMPVDEESVRQFVESTMEISSSSGQENAIMALLQREIEQGDLLLVQGSVNKHLSSSSARANIQSRIDYLIHENTK